MSPRFPFRLPRTASILLLGLTPVITAVVPTASAAPATPAVLSCTGNVTATFEPPLTNTQKQTDGTFRDDLDYCPLGGVTSGKSTSEFSALDSCTTVSLPGEGFFIYEWNTGQSSTVHFTTTTSVRLNGTTQVTSIGTVTSGFDHGASATRVVVVPELDPTACAGAGVSQQTQPESLTFN